MKYLVLIMFLTGVVFGQQAKIMNTQLLFSSTETIANDANGAPYFTMTNADTATSKFLVMGNGANGDVRVSVMFDTTSGTLAGTTYVGIKIGDFGTDALDYKWLELGAFSASDNGVPLTYLLWEDVTGWKAPVEGYKIRIITTGTQSTKAYVSRIQYFPRER